MTCIAAIKADDGTIYMAGDSGHTTDGYTVEVGEPKVRLVERAQDTVLLGCSGSGGLVRAAWQTADYAIDADDFCRTMCAHLGGAPDQREGLPFTGLWAQRGQLFVIDGTFGASEVPGFTAIGAGRDFALGALHTMGTGVLVPVPPLVRVKEAVWAAINFSSTCRGPTTALTLERQPVHA